MIGMTLCSGIGAPEIAAPWIDWRFASEIEAFPRAVLAERFGYVVPDDQNQGEPLLWGDMATITPDLWREHGIPLPNIVVAGTPCQSFSVAGLRKGIKDDRGNLTLKFVEICHDIVTSRPDGKLVVLWENVPGILSDKENAFGNFLAALVGGNHALCNPTDGGWPSEGMVEGPRARIAWRVLDAQHFGLPQRRRRVFLVASFGTSKLDPAKVLFEPKGLRGDIEAREHAGQETASYSQTSIGECRKGRGTLRTSGGDVGGGSENTIISNSGSKAFCLNAGGMGRQDAETIIAFDCKAGGKTGLAIGDKSTALRGEGHGGGHSAVAFAKKSSRSEFAVRRLTPPECHRLQGFEDDHCAINYRGKPASDRAQYKALGNSMAVPVVRWILDRISAEVAA